MVDEAHANKLPVVAHAHRPEEIRRGLAAGVGLLRAHRTQPQHRDILRTSFKALHERTAKMSLGPLFWTSNN